MTKGEDTKLMGEQTSDERAQDGFTLVESKKKKKTRPSSKTRALWKAKQAEVAKKDKGNEMESTKSSAEKQISIEQQGTKANKHGTQGSIKVPSESQMVDATQTPGLDKSPIVLAEVQGLQNETAKTVQEGTHPRQYRQSNNKRKYSGFI